MAALLVKLFLITILISLSYFLGSYTHVFSHSAAPLQVLPHPSHCLQLNSTTHLPISPPLRFEPLHTLTLPQQSSKKLPFLFKFCPNSFTNYLPCHDPSLEKDFSVERFFYRERHCPRRRVKCLVPKPVGYRRPFEWAKSKDYAWFNNVPFKKLSVFKKSQNWVRLEGDRFVFPGGGTSFKLGVKGYVDLIKKVVPLKSGKIITVLDVGCGVASFGAALMDYDILSMSIVPRDIHEAQVQFALERGLPAMLGILRTYRLPYPSRSFDLEHCARCLVPWTNYDRSSFTSWWLLGHLSIGILAIKVGRERLRTCGMYRSGWKILLKDCRKKIAERGPIAVWQSLIFLSFLATKGN